MRVFIPVGIIGPLTYDITYQITDPQTCIIVIDTRVRVSNLLKLNDIGVLNAKGWGKDCIEIREKKTPKAKNFPIGKSVAKAIIDVVKPTY